MLKVAKVLSGYAQNNDQSMSDKSENQNPQILDMTYMHIYEPGANPP